MPLPYRIVALQLWAALVLAAALLFVGRDQAAAALLGGAVCVLPAGYFAWRVEHERSAARLLGHGVMKSMTTVALMALVFATLQPPLLGFFSAFVLLQLMYVVGPLGRRGR